MPQKRCNEIEMAYATYSTNVVQTFNDPLNPWKKITQKQNHLEHWYFSFQYPITYLSNTIFMYLQKLLSIVLILIPFSISFVNFQFWLFGLPLFKFLGKNIESSEFGTVGSIWIWWVSLQTSPDKRRNNERNVSNRHQLDAFKYPNNWIENINKNCVVVSSIAVNTFSAISGFKFFVFFLPILHVALDWERLLCFVVQSIDANISASYVF